MRVILLQDIKHLGRKDEVVDVNNGYARNYLFPKSLAVEASKDNLLKLQVKKDAQEYKKNLETEGFKQQADKINSISLKIKAKAR